MIKFSYSNLFTMLGLYSLLSFTAWADPAHVAHKHHEDHKHHEGHKHHEDHKPAHHHSFDHPEKWAKKWEGKKRDQEQQPHAVMKHCGIEAGMTVVDLGVGTGYFTPYLARQVGQKGKVLALDIEAQMIDWIKAKVIKHQWTQVEPKLVKPNNPMLAPQTIDRILIVNVWHHIDQRQAYLSKLTTALKASGKLCIVEFKLDSPWGPPKKHRLSPETLKAELKKGGMKGFQQLDLLNQYVLVSRP